MTPRLAAAMHLRALLLLILSASAFAQQAGPATDAPRGPQLAQLFAWWDGLGFPNVEHAPAVRLHYWGGEALGFLLSEDAGGAHVLLADLSEHHAVAAHPAETGLASATYERVEFEAAILGYLDDVRQGTGRQNAFPGLANRAQFVHLARVCEQRGLGALVDALLAQACVIRERFERSRRPLRGSLRERVWGDLEYTLKLRTWNLGGELVQRRAAFLRYAQRLPESSYAAKARDLASVLERMIAEEQRGPTRETLDGLSGVNLAHALILRMRTMEDSVGSIWGNPPPIFVAPFGEPPSPADQLLALGDVAIPTLIEACDDEALTLIWFTGRVGHYPGILTVGDCACLVLHEITGEHPAGNAADWKTWWLRKQRSGEIAALIDRVLAFDAHSLAAARELATAAPADALWPIEVSVLKSGTDWAQLENRLPWIELYGSLDHPRVARFLTLQTLSGGRTTHRVAAAMALERIDPAGAVSAARHIFAHISKTGHVTPNRGEGRLTALTIAENTAARRLIDYLAERREFGCLAADFSQRWPHLRASIARSVAKHTLQDALANRLLRQALADVTALVDRQELAYARGMSGARVCDVAALALHRCMPTRFPFDLLEGPVARTAHIQTITAALAP